MPQEPGKIRNVAVVGHRGTGKTSLVEAMLFQAGKINRLGTVEAGTHRLRLGRGRAAAADVARRVARAPRVAGPQDQPDRHARRLGLPGRHDREPARRRGRARRRLGRDGRRGEHRRASWNRAEELELSRVVFVNMLDRERADFYRTLAALQEQLSSSCVAIQLPIGAEHELTGIVDLLHNCAYMDPSAARARATRCRSPTRWPTTAAEYREKLLDAVVETDEALMERYLGGEELDPHDDRGGAQDRRHERRALSRSRAASRRRTSARTRCSTCSSRACRRRRASRRRSTPTGTAAFVFKTVADPFAGRISASASTSGTVARRLDARQPARPREGAARRADGAAGQGARAGRRVRRRATSAPSRS